jgi:hypothetical protein
MYLARSTQCSKTIHLIARKQKKKGEGGGGEGRVAKDLGRVREGEEEEKPVSHNHLWGICSVT